MQGMAKFFKEAETKLKQSCLQDPTNSENYIDAYLDDDQTRSKVLSLVSAQSKVMQRAVELVEDGKEEDAVQELKKIFEDDSKTASAIRDSNFYPSVEAIGVAGAKTNNANRIISPKS